MYEKIKYSFGIGKYVNHFQFTNPRFILSKMKFYGLVNLTIFSNELNLPQDTLFKIILC